MEQTLKDLEAFKRLSEIDKKFMVSFSPEQKANTNNYDNK